MYDVFVSHSSKNKDIADAVCHALESSGIKCWIAPRDINPGAEYAAELMFGIRSCKVFLLIFSADSNLSRPVANELENAFRFDKIIIPFRLEDVEMRESFSFYLANLQWLDAIADEKSYETLVRVVRHSIGATPEPTLPEEDAKTTIVCNHAPRIRLRNEESPEQFWEFDLDDIVFAGRAADCRLRLNDPSVSRVQFKLFAQGSAAAVENMSESNVTLLGGEPITKPTLLKVGDKLKCGRITLVAEVGI
jgi:hypothetical protein